MAVYCNGGAWVSCGFGAGDFAAVAERGRDPGRFFGTDATGTEKRGSRSPVPVAFWLGPY
jgi:hypothetical protein